MDLKEKLLASFMAFEAQVDIDSDLHDIRTSAIKNFENKGFPTKKDEAWKYTSLNQILKSDYSVFPKTESIIDFPAVKKYFLHEIDTYKVVFIDGVFSSFLSSTTHDGIDVCLMSSALTKPKYKMVIDEYFNKAASKDRQYIHFAKGTEHRGGPHIFIWWKPDAQQPELFPPWRAHRFDAERHYDHRRPAARRPLHIGQSRDAELRKPPELQRDLQRPLNRRFQRKDLRRKRSAKNRRVPAEQ
jgi:hypothetical protein